MTIEEIYALPVDGKGWRILPNGNRLHIGTNVQSLIDLSKVGSGAVIGLDAVIGPCAVIGEKSVHLFSPLAVQGSRHLAGNYAPGIIQIGCQRHSFAYWLEHAEGIAREHGYTKEQQAEYRKIVEFIAATGVPAEEVAK